MSAHFNRSRHRLLTLACVAATFSVTSFGSTAIAQSSLGVQQISLADLSAFRPTTSNWQTAGTVSVTRATDHTLFRTPGAGILVNLPADGANGDLVTSFSHADIQLDLEVNIPRGSDAAILLQGRYELQIADSWGATAQDPSAFGSVNGEQPPSVNVARAPGLWQKLSILFRAPRFDRNSRKITNAAFVRVTLNGVTIQEEVELEAPTELIGSGASPNDGAEQADDGTRVGDGDDDGSEGADLAEVPSAPLVFHSGNGPVAFRNIRYTLLDNGPVAARNLTYEYFRGDFGWELPDFGSLTRVSGGETAAISSVLADTLNNFALNFSGDLVLPATGDYRFEVTYTGQFSFLIDGQTVVDIESPEVAAVGEVPRKAASKRLSAGNHTFELKYARGRWHVAENALGLYVAGPGSIRTRLSAADSDTDDVWAAFKVEPGDKPRLQRSFVLHPSGERVHAISVGYPNGNHYAYDTETGSLLHLWRGRFIDTSTMWFSRGNDQLAAPQGSLIELSGRPTVAPDLVAGAATGNAASEATGLASTGSSMPNSLSSAQKAIRAAPPGFRFRDYRIDAAGNPTFAYTVGDVTVRDALKPDGNGRYFTRTISVSGPDDQPIPLRLADDPSIREVSEGVFDIGDGTYQIEVVAGAAEIVSAGGVQQLVAMPVPSTSGDAGSLVKVNIVW